MDCWLIVSRCAVQTTVASDQKVCAALALNAIRHVVIRTLIRPRRQDLATWAGFTVGHALFVLVLTSATLRAHSCGSGRSGELTHWAVKALSTIAMVLAGWAFFAIHDVVIRIKVAGVVGLDPLTVWAEAALALRACTAEFTSRTVLACWRNCRGVLAQFAGDAVNEIVVRRFARPRFQIRAEGTHLAAALHRGVLVCAEGARLAAGNVGDLPIELACRAD
jgi:hypothetical protein